jgi:hypothetical protein
MLYILYHVYAGATERSPMDQPPQTLPRAVTLPFLPYITFQSSHPAHKNVGSDNLHLYLLTKGSLHSKRTDLNLASVTPLSVLVIIISLADIHTEKVFLKFEFCVVNKSISSTY